MEGKANNCIISETESISRCVGLITPGSSPAAAAERSRMDLCGDGAHRAPSREGSPGRRSPHSLLRMALLGGAQQSDVHGAKVEKHYFKGVSLFLNF